MIPVSDSDRPRVDELRRLLLSAFERDDQAEFAGAVLELERLCGLEHGERCSPDRREANSRAGKVGRRAQWITWARRKLVVEREGGVTTYSYTTR